jgi:hypothetical protein
VEGKAGSEKIEIIRPSEDEIHRAAKEHLERVRSASRHGKPGRVPREGRPRLRGGPAAAAVIEGRR